MVLLSYFIAEKWANVTCSC